uniref:RNA polymerase III subunit C6 n=1 Tax=Fagus sylvatica TaxID=28930 RepID=A0A2N9IQV3_FAGSY
MASSRGRPPTAEDNRKVLQAILSKENNGITKPQIRFETKLSDVILKKCIDVLISQKKIKEVADIRNKRNKLFMGVGFEASAEITGGEWYTDGKLDVEFISTLKVVCLQCIQRVKVASVGDIAESIARTGVFRGNNIDLQQIHHILGALELDGEVEKMTNDLEGHVSNVPIGKICYRSSAKKLAKTNAMVSIPCGVCPQISYCTPDGIISPITCVYYEKWLDF